MDISELEEVIKKDTQEPLTKIDLTVADHTGYIVMTLWEEEAKSASETSTLTR